MLNTVNSDNNSRFVEIALPVPLRRLFDYQLSDDLKQVVEPGMRLIVPFGRRKMTGLVVSVKSTTEIPMAKIKPVISLVDQQAVISPNLLELISWVADYYQQPLGEVYKVALPSIYLPKASDLSIIYRLSAEIDIEETRLALKRAPSQKKIVEIIHQHETPISQDQLGQMMPGWRGPMKALTSKRIVEQSSQPFLWPQEDPGEISKPPALSSAQVNVIEQLSNTLDRFNVSLLKGVTGSGKTEVYLQLAKQVLVSRRQILVLVPEIALTPQLVARFEQRLGLKAAVLHSSLSEKRRRISWQAAASGQARIILGTRSAVFACMPDLGLIILDEEHDMSYKQQEGVRYHARDVAIMRAKQEGISVVMGSATPSLESLANVIRGRYQLCELNERVADAVMPAIHMLSLDQLKVKQGLSVTLINAIEKNLEKKQQTLIFINRRGYAPIVICKACGEMASCQHCHARLVYHVDGRLKCHHCGVFEAAGDRCRSCDSNALNRLGQGTQRIEQVLTRLFPQARIARLDRDVTRKKDSLESVLEDMSAGQVDILIGTQMLAKGHDFPNVTLVGIVNADQGLFGMDYHATESMIQQLVQVSGRAGRASVPGRVLIQSHFPQHPLYAHVCSHDYTGFARQELKLREQAGFPPYHYLALIRAWDKNETAPLAFLNHIKRLASGLQAQFPMISVMQPVYSPMAKVNRFYRAQLLVTSPSRNARQHFLKKWITLIEDDQHKLSVKWSVDVDPLDLY